MRVCVIGGGIAGLSAAYALQKGSRASGMPLEIVLFEREPRLGGKILTERMDGFVIEGGPDTFVSTKPWGVQLCRELGIEDRLQGTDMDRRRVYVLHRGRLVEMPDGLAMMVPTQIWPMLKTRLLSPAGKLRMGLDLVLPRRGNKGDESLGNFIRRRLGSEVYERLIEPLMSGIYAGDGDRLSLGSTFPFLSEWEGRYGSVVRGALALRRKRRSSFSANGRPSIFLTPQTGLAELVDQLQAELDGVDLHLGEGIHACEARVDGFRLETEAGRSYRAEVVVLAAPAFVSAELLGGLDPELAELLGGIEYVSTATVSLAYREEDLNRPLDGHGYVIPRVEGRQALACTWTSSKFPHRAPAGKALVRVFIGRAGQSEVVVADEQRLLDIARSELAETLGLHAEPILVRVHRWPRAMPQYNIGHLERMDQIGARLMEHPGIFLAGAAYEGIGIPDCIHSGQRAAEEALAFLNHSAGLEPSEKR